MKNKRLVFCFLMLNLLVNVCYAAYPAPVAAQHGMVVSDQQLASQVGVDILKQGGNAIDAAVAVGYALAVVQPCCGNLGGGGFMTIHFANGKNTFINFREKAPLAASKNMYLDAKGNLLPNKTLKGYLAVGVTGTVLGLNTALQKYGTMSLKQVIAPAIKLAEEGYQLMPGDVTNFSGDLKNFKEQANVAAIFLKNGQPYQVGERLIQKNLANTLKLIANQGSDAFYKGSITDAIVNASKQNGGILTHDDFARYNVEELPPLNCIYHGYTIVSAPPPSSGGVTLCEMLNILEPYPLAELGFHSAQAVHYLVEAMRYAYYDRNQNLGDPNFVNNPTAKLLAKDYATKIRAKIQKYQATASASLGAGVDHHESTNTTHYSVMDRFGNAVAVTYTIDNYFGAQVIAGDTGFFLNNEMDDFTAKVNTPNQFGLVQGEANAIQPGKRPLSSMTPTIVLKDNKVFMVLGSPGGSTIITTLLQIIVNVIDYGMDIQAAVDAPRIHMQWLPDKVLIEPFALSDDTQQKLGFMGYQFTQHEPWGVAEAILVSPTQPILFGGSDDRRSAGKAIGY